MSASIRTKTPLYHHGPVIDTVEGFDVIDCEACGFRHVMPLPDAAAMQAAYREAYYRDEKPDYLTRARADQDWAELAQKDRLTLFARHLPRHRRCLIDVGSGPGFFLKTASEAGWRAIGVEPSRQAAAHTRQLGLEVIEGFFGEELSGDLPEADVIHMNNVLEHVPDPIAILSHAQDQLRPGGLVCVSVPNDYNALQTALRRAENYRPWWVAPPHHLNYFDFASLDRLLARTGFSPIDVLTSFPMELFLLMGENYVGDDARGRECHARRMRFDLALEKAGMGDVRRRLYGALAEAGLGRDACIIARKN